VSNKLTNGTCDWSRGFLRFRRSPSDEGGFIRRFLESLTGFNHEHLLDLRSETFVKNMQNFMEEEKKDRAILNVGVAHVEKVTELLEKDSFSYLVVWPDGLAETLDYLESQKHQF